MKPQTKYKLKNNGTSPPLGRPRKYPWTDMQVNDYFDAAIRDTHGLVVRSAASKAGRVYGMKFSVHKTGPRAVRVWRIK